MPAEFTANRVRVLVFLHRKEGVSAEEFSKYWKDEHGDLFCNLPIIKKNLTRYEQVSSTSLYTVKLKPRRLLARLPQFHFNMPYNEELAKLGLFKSEHYGVAILESDSEQKIIDILSDPDYINIIQPDQDKFFDRSMMEAILGKSAVFFDK